MIRLPLVRNRACLLGSAIRLVTPEKVAVQKIGELKLFGLLCVLAAITHFRLLKGGRFYTYRGSVYLIILRLGWARIRGTLEAFL